MKAFGQCLTFFHRIAHNNTTARENNGELGGRQKIGSSIQAVFPARAAINTHGLWNFAGDFAIEIVARNVELGWAHFRDGPIKTTGCDFGHALGVHHMALILGELLEHRKLICFLETAKAHAHGSGFRSNDDNRTVRPVGCRDSRHAVTNSRAVLTNHHTMTTRDACIAISHMGRTLLMHHRNKSNTRRREDIHGIHEG